MRLAITHNNGTGHVEVVGLENNSSFSSSSITAERFIYYLVTLHIIIIHSRSIYLIRHSLTKRIKWLTREVIKYLIVTELAHVIIQFGRDKTEWEKPWVITRMAWIRLDKEKKLKWSTRGDCKIRYSLFSTTAIRFNWLWSISPFQFGVVPGWTEVHVTWPRDSFLSAMSRQLPQSVYSNWINTVRLHHLVTCGPCCRQFCNNPGIAPLTFLVNKTTLGEIEKNR